MLDLMYDLPDVKEEGAKYIIDADGIEKHKPLAEMREAKTRSA